MERINYHIKNYRENHLVRKGRCPKFEQSFWVEFSALSYPCSKNVSNEKIQKLGKKRKKGSLVSNHVHDPVQFRFQRDRGSVYLSRCKVPTRFSLTGHHKRTDTKNGSLPFFTPIFDSLFFKANTLCRSRGFSSQRELKSPRHMFFHDFCFSQ